jgi:hypothetical protein
MSAQPVNFNGLNNGYSKIIRCTDGFAYRGSPTEMGLVDKARMMVLSGRYVAMVPVVHFDAKGMPIHHETNGKAVPLQTHPKCYDANTLRHTIFVDREAFDPQLPEKIKRTGLPLLFTRWECPTEATTGSSRSRSVPDAICHCVMRMFLAAHPRDHMPIALHSVTVDMGEFGTKSQVPYYRPNVAFKSKL